VSAIQNAQIVHTALPMAATIAICATAALIINFCTKSAATTPAATEEAEASVIVGEI
jgi:hypothetical protein